MEGSDLLDGDNGDSQCSREALRLSNLRRIQELQQQLQQAILAQQQLTAPQGHGVSLDEGAMDPSSVSWLSQPGSHSQLPSQSINQQASAGLYSDQSQPPLPGHMTTANHSYQHHPKRLKSSLASAHTQASLPLTSTDYTQPMQPVWDGVSVPGMNVSGSAFQAKTINIQLPAQLPTPTVSGPGVTTDSQHHQDVKGKGTPGTSQPWKRAKKEALEEIGIGVPAKVDVDVQPEAGHEPKEEIIMQVKKEIWTEMLKNSNELYQKEQKGETDTQKYKYLKDFFYKFKIRASHILADGSSFDWSSPLEIEGLPQGWHLYSRANIATKITCQVYIRNQSLLGPYVRLASEIVEFGPHGVDFSQPITMAIPMRAEPVEGQHLDVMTSQDGVKWTEMSYNVINNYCKISVKHFSWFAMIYCQEKVDIQVSNNAEASIVTKEDSNVGLKIYEGSIEKQRDITMHVVKVPSDADDTLKEKKIAVGTILHFTQSEDSNFLKPVEVNLSIPEEITRSKLKEIRVLKEDKGWHDITNEINYKINGQYISFKTTHISCFVVVLLYQACNILAALQRIIAGIRYTPAKVYLMQEVREWGNLLVGCTSFGNIKEQIDDLRSLKEYTKGYEFKDVYMEEGQQIYFKLNEEQFKPIDMDCMEPITFYQHFNSHTKIAVLKNDHVKHQRGGYLTAYSPKSQQTPPSPSECTFTARLYFNEYQIDSTNSYKTPKREQIESTHRQLGSAEYNEQPDQQRPKTSYIARSSEPTTPQWFSTFIINFERKCTVRNFKDLKLQATSFGFQHGELEKMSELIDLLQAMQRHGQLGPDNFKVLKAMVGGCGEEMNCLLKYIEDVEMDRSLSVNTYEEIRSTPMSKGKWIKGKHVKKRSGTDKRKWGNQTR